MIILFIQRHSNLFQDPCYFWFSLWWCGVFQSCYLWCCVWQWESKLEYKLVRTVTIKHLLLIVLHHFPPDTCAPDWVSTRDNLIISSFVFSLLTLLIVGVAGIIFYIYYYQGGCVTIHLIIIFLLLIPGDIYRNKVSYID